MTGIMRACYTNLDRPIYECPEIWITHEYVLSTPGWRFQFDLPDPLADESPWRIGLDAWIGHFVVYENGNTRAVWRIAWADWRRNQLLAKWPD